MTTDLSRQTVCFVDNGLFGGFARRVAPAFKKAYYSIRSVSAFPSVKRTDLWKGFDEFEVINEPLSRAGEIDLWVFLDVFSADLQQFLVANGARVWGARSGEDMELDRLTFKQTLRRVGLPVGPFEHIVGVEKLRKFLKERKNWYVKGRSGWTRGDMETWKWKDEHISTCRLDEIEYDLGAAKHDFEFVVEEEIDKAVEIGYDGYTVDGLLPSPSMQGLEVKGLGLLGVVKPYDKLSAPVRMANAALSGELSRAQYRGFMCMEMRKTDGTAPHVTDPCARLGSPSNELLQTLLKGWPKILWEGAEGRLVNPEVADKYGMVAMVYSEQSGKNPQPLSYPKELDPWVILRNAYRNSRGEIYSVPQGAPQNVAGVVGTGKTILEAVTVCAERAKQVNGQGIEISLDAISKAVETAAEGEKYGVRFTDDRLPSAAELAKAVK